MALKILRGMDLALCEEAIDFENLNTGVFQLLKRIFIHWCNLTESYRTTRKRTWKGLSSFYLTICRCKTPPQNSAEAKKLGGDQLSVKDW